MQNPTSSSAQNSKGWKIPSSKLSKFAFDHILREHLGRLSKSYDRCVVEYGYGRSSTNARISTLILKIDDKVEREGGLTPPEPEVESSPVSAKGSNLFRFWIAELAVYTQLVLIFKTPNIQRRMHHRPHTRERGRGGQITGEPSGGHMTSFRGAGGWWRVQGWGGKLTHTTAKACLCLF